MSFAPKPVQDIDEAIIAEVESEVGSSIRLLAVAFTRVLSKALAGSIALLYSYANFIFAQLFVSTASFKTTTVSGRAITPLIEWGRFVGVGDPVAATAAELTVLVTVTNQTGQPIPAGTTLVYEPTGVTYVTLTGINRDASAKSVNIEAVSDQSGGSGLGSIGNLELGSLVSFASPVPDVVRDTTVTTIVTTAADAESELAYRERVLDHFQKRPQGGALADYEQWGEAVAGITDVYPYTSCPGEIDLYCEATPESSGDPDGIPTDAQLQAVEDAVNLDDSGRATQRPANAFVRALPITRKPFDVNVVGLSAPDQAATEQAINDALVALFKTYEPFIGGLTVTPRDRVTLAEISGEVFGVAQANSATFSAISVSTAVTVETLWSASVVVSSDDARETATVVTLTDTTLAMDSANTIGMRFQNVNVPAGSTIVSASLQFTASGATSEYAVLDISGHATSNPGTFTTAASDLSSRPRTASRALWVPTEWADNSENTVDVTAIVSEVIGIPGWAPLNAMAFIATTTYASGRTAHAYDGDPAKAALLSISYSAPATAVQPIDVTTLGIGEKAKLGTLTFI
jgi:uncharacterized phage protein gp47/JayE